MSAFLVKSFKCLRGATALAVRAQYLWWPCCLYRASRKLSPSALLECTRDKPSTLDKRVVLLLLLLPFYLTTMSEAMTHSEKNRQVFE